MEKDNQLPRGWWLAGSHPDSYVVTNHPQALGNATAVRLRRRDSDRPTGFGTVMQSFRADAYRGRRLRFEAAVRVDGAVTGAGLWMRVDGSERGWMLAYDNMWDRRIRGTADWQRVAIVLDVREAATVIAFGILLHGAGEVWFAEPRIEIVGLNIPLTSPREPPALPDHPLNLELSAADAR